MKLGKIQDIETLENPAEFRIKFEIDFDSDSEKLRVLKALKHSKYHTFKEGEFEELSSEYEDLYALGYIKLNIKTKEFKLERPFISLYLDSTGELKVEDTFILRFFKEDVRETINSMMDKLVRDCESEIEWNGGTKDFLKEEVEMSDFSEHIPENPIKKMKQNLQESKNSKLTEGNQVTDKLPADLDSFLQDVAQFYGEFDYTDIMKFADKQPGSENLDALKKLKKMAAEAEETDDLDGFDLIAETAADIVFGTSDFSKKDFKDTEVFKYFDNKDL